MCIEGLPSRLPSAVWFLGLWPVGLPVRCRATPAARVVNAQVGEGSAWPHSVIWLLTFPLGFISQGKPGAPGPPGIPGEPVSCPFLT